MRNSTVPNYNPVSISTPAVEAEIDVEVKASKKREAEQQQEQAVQKTNDNL
jgi:hypothetical protein